jgi:predicted lipid-binding transport protein (Tim44 family)
MMFEGAYVLGGLIFTVIAGIFIALLGAEFGIRAFMIFASICYLGGLLFNFPFSDEKQK